jgi:hypothetical protein
VPRPTLAYSDCGSKRPPAGNALMDFSTKELCQSYITTRRQHPGWQLLASRRAPLLLSCLKPLFELGHDGIDLEDAQQHLSDLLAQHGNSDEFALESDDYPAIARKELRDWIRRGLVVEREGKLMATDALQQVMRFADGLNDRIMTSTASRLATVQREIENLETRLNPNAQSRAAHIKRKIKALQEELAQVETGHFEVLEGFQAEEGVREVYNLAISLRADFRRVEDSYREADRRLRHSIISEQHHRGEIVDRLLDGHDALLETAEGQVFHGFYEQLHRSVELDNMKQRVRGILHTPAARTALTRQQRSELRWLIANLVSESANVIRARARSERDVKGFLKTGLAAEHHRVGELLNQIFEAALNVDWERAAVRRSAAPLPPVAVAIAGLPLIERLRFKSVERGEAGALELGAQFADLDEVEDDFWEAFDTLDRQDLIARTLELLNASGRSMGIADLASRLPPSHDLETLALWLAMAREADAPVHSEHESVEVADRHGQRLRFNVPRIELAADALNAIDWEL